MFRNTLHTLRAWGLLLCVVLWPCMQTQASGTTRDAEIEEFLTQCIEPLCKITGLRVKIWLISNHTLNAFATSSQDIYITSGLLTEGLPLEAILGVLAHEMGHLHHGHTLRQIHALESLQKGMMTSFLLGAVTGVISGRGDMGVAMALGASHAAQNRMLYFSQGEESAADLAASQYCQKLQWPLQGLLSFLKKLQNRSGPDMSHRLTTHPPTSARLQFFKKIVAQQPKTWSTPPLLEKQYGYIAAKIRGFLDEPEMIAKNLAQSTRPEDRYTYAIALCRLERFQEAFACLDSLLLKDPQNPYFHEVKGQFLLEDGRIHEGRQAYHRALQLKPSSSLIKMGYAQALIMEERSADLPQARHLLESIQKKEESAPFLWHMLAIVYGRAHNVGLCQWALARKALLHQDKKSATHHLERAIKHLSPRAPERIHARDLLYKIKNS